MRTWMRKGCARNEPSIRVISKHVIKRDDAWGPSLRGGAGRRPSPFVALGALASDAH